MRDFDWRKYALAFIITALIFITAIFLADYISRRKVEEIRTIQDQISTDILSSEVQSALLEEFSCKEVGDNLLSKELNQLGEKLSFTEDTRGSDDTEFIALKRYYSLLQIKDFLLMKRVSEKCNISNEFILYFYQKDCSECQKQGYVLTRLKDDFPQLRVYSFDYNIDLPAVQTLISINKIDNSLPVLYIDGKILYGFQDIENIEKAIPILKQWREEWEKQATSTQESSDNS
jgi:hypothetical protein